MQVSTASQGMMQQSFQSSIKPDAKATEVAEQFEALFLHKLLEPMQDNEAMFGKGAEARTFSGMFRENLAKELSKTRPLGIANYIEESIQNQSGAGKAPAINQEGAYDELIQSL